MAEYIAYPCGKMNQSFAVRNAANEIVYEANMIKFSLFGASDFEFVNKETGFKVSHKVGKTHTTEQGIGGINVTTSSYFKLDGEKCFDLLAKKGLSFKVIAKLDILHPEFGLVDASGNTLATLKMNVKGPKQENVRAIGNTQRNTVINTESEDLDTVFFAAFILGRVDFSMFLV